MRQGLKTRFQTSDRAGSGVRPWTWASPGGMGAVHMRPTLELPQEALDQSVFPPSPEYLPSHICREKSKVLKLAKSILEKAGKQNGPQREAARRGPACLGTRLPCRPRFLTVPSGGCPDKRGASYWVSAASSQDDSNWIVSDYY